MLQILLQIPDSDLNARPRKQKTEEPNLNLPIYLDRASIR